MYAGNSLPVSDLLGLGGFTFCHHRTFSPQPILLGTLPLCPLHIHTVFGFGRGDARSSDFVLCQRRQFRMYETGNDESHLGICTEEVVPPSE